MLNPLKHIIMRAIILNHAASCVDVYDLPDYLFGNNNEDGLDYDIERYLSSALGYDPFTPFLLTDEDRTPVFHNRNEEPSCFI